MELIGTIRFQPDLRFTPDGKAVCNFTIQLEDAQKELVKVVTWDDLAENCSQNLEQWNRVRVFGYKKTREYQTREGETKTLEEFVAYRVQLFAKE